MARRGKKKKGRCTRRNKQASSDAATEPEELKNAPHTFVMNRGKVGSYVRELIRDFRRVMEPFTASSLRVLRKNTYKDFVSVAGMLHVTHFCVFTRTDLGAYLKITRVPRGPTLSFRIHNYTLARDIISTLKRQLVFSKQFEHPPLIVLNGFSGEGRHIKLMASTFQNMFPPINILKVDLNDIRRCVLLNYDPASKLIDFRHYAIKVVPAGISKSAKKIVQSKVPNLSRYGDVSEYFTNPVQLSESEGEDDPASQVVLPQKMSSRGNIASSVSAIRVVEIGPRFTIQLLKIETGFFDGDVLYHDYIQKSDEEIKLMKKKLEQKRQMKMMRKKIQENNKKIKEEKKQTLKEKSVIGMQAKFSQNNEESGNVERKYQKDNEKNEEEEEDDDVQWYKEEVGQNPDPDLFTTSTTGTTKRKQQSLPYFKHKKRAKNEKADNSEKFLKRTTSNVKRHKKVLATKVRNRRK